MLDVEMIRRDFLILSRQVNGKPLVYLDNGASAQKPQVVIDAISTAYSQEYANVHRGLHYLSNLATDNYERVRGIVALFLGAASEDEIESPRVCWRGLFSNVTQLFDLRSSLHRMLPLLLGAGRSRWHCADVLSCTS